MPDASTNTAVSEEEALRQKKYDEMTLPSNFEERIQQLPSSILVHIPSCLRQCMPEISTANLLGVQRGEMHFNLLEQARNKLLMMPVKAGRCPTTERSKRFLSLRAKSVRRAFDSY
jgi:hypothetical protein